MEKTLNNAQKIPKIIHYVWLGGKAKPDYLIKNLESWKKYCPDYEIKEWNETNFDLSSNRYLEEAIKMKKWAFASDYIRLAVLYNEGGIYLDTDVEILKPLDKFLRHDFFTNFENLAMICFAVTGTVKGGKIVGEMLSKYQNKPFILNEKKGKMDLTTNVILGSVMMRDTFNFKLDNTYQEQIIEGENCAVYPTEYFFAQDYVSKEFNYTENSHGVHIYASSWIGKKQKREDRFVEILREILGEKRFRKVMKKFLIARVNQFAKIYKKQV